MKSGGESTNKGFYFAVLEFLNKQITKFVSHFFLHRLQLNNAQNQYRTIASDNTKGVYLNGRSFRPSNGTHLNSNATGIMSLVFASTDSIRSVCR